MDMPCNVRWGHVAILERTRATNVGTQLQLKYPNTNFKQKSWPQQFLQSLLCNITAETPTPVSLRNTVVNIQGRGHRMHLFAKYPGSIRDLPIYSLHCWCTACCAFRSLYLILQLKSLPDVFLEESECREGVEVNADLGAAFLESDFLSHSYELPKRSSRPVSSFTAGCALGTAALVAVVTKLTLLTLLMCQF